MDEQDTRTRPIVILITGSSSGIGASIAQDLSRKNCIVIVTGRDQNKIDQILSKCNQVDQNGQDKVYGFRADLSNWTEIEDLLDFIKKRFGCLDILINNVCYRGESMNILNTTMDQYEHIHRMNVSVPIYLVHKMITNLKRSHKDSQVVINISSAASRVVVPLHGYSITKACISELTQQLTKLKNLICLTISPGPVLTDERPHHEAMSSLTLVQRVGLPQEISNLVLFCLDNVSMFRGQEVFIDGGYLAREHVRCCIGKR